jgi:hypothetical protein
MGPAFPGLWSPSIDHPADRLWRPWLRIRRLLRAMLTLRVDAETWRQVKPEIRKAMQEQRRIERAGWFN